MGCEGLDIGDQDRLGELVGAGDDGAGGVDDHRTPVEDQLVLAADLVDVHDGHAGLGDTVDQRTCWRTPILACANGDALRFTMSWAPPAASSATGPPGIQTSSQIVTPTVDAGDLVQIEGVRPGTRSSRSSSNTS